MKIMIINCHTANRGDEAAVRALIDELMGIYDDLSVTIALKGPTKYPNLPSNVKVINQYGLKGKDAWIKSVILKITKGNASFMKQAKLFFDETKTADIVLHAPGGPSIGDLYYKEEPMYLQQYDMLNKLGIPYMFYAPSMGPFNIKKRNAWRKRIINGSQAIALRDPISASYVKELIPNKQIFQTLDSALQHDINIVENEEKLNSYLELKDFLQSHEKCIGVTITDLLWHPVYSKETDIPQNIKNTFELVLTDLSEQGYGIVFIPQLYGTGNDYDLMKKFCFNDKDYFIIPANEEKYDTYFQQYLIGQLYAVIGMRYHSNIFSAKMGTPFISISYEQKMKGFMHKMELDQYCIDLEGLNDTSLSTKFKMLENKHDDYKRYLKSKHDEMKMKSYRTTELVKDVLDGIMKDKK